MTANFYTGPMGCGKTTLLMQDVFNAEGSYALFTGSEFGVIKSKAFGEDTYLEATYVRSSGHLTVPLALGPYKYIFVDEAQFLSLGAVRELFAHAHKHGTHLRFYGLISDFKGQPFDGSSQIIALCDNYVRLPGLVPCWCGADAIMNTRVVNGEVVHEGPKVLEGGIVEAEIYYRPLCRQHWYEKRLRREDEPLDKPCASW